jgi:Flp pilus assembly CpaE family ATPase
VQSGAGGRGIGPAGPISVAGVLRVLDYARRLADVVVVDVPCTYTDFQFEVLGAIPQIVLVGEQSIASIRTIKLILDSLSAGTARHTFEVVLNRYEPTMDGLTSRDLEKALGLAKVRTIPDDHAGVLSAVNQGLLLRQAVSDSPMLTAIDSLVDALLGKAEAGHGTNGTGFFRRLFHSFTNQ